MLFNFGNSLLHRSARNDGLIATIVKLSSTGTNLQESEQTWNKLSLPSCKIGQDTFPLAISCKITFLKQNLVYFSFCFERS